MHSLVIKKLILKYMYVTKACRIILLGLYTLKFFQ